MSVNPYLTFPGTCAEALTFYENALGAAVNMRPTHAETPAPGNPEWSAKIMHANFTILGTQLMASDAPPGMYRKPAGFRVALNLTEPDAYSSGCAQSVQRRGHPFQCSQALE